MFLVFQRKRNGLSFAQALENCPLSEYHLIDNTYLDRMKIRQSIMDKYGAGAYGCNVPCESAVFELYVESMF